MTSDDAIRRCSRCALHSLEMCTMLSRYSEYMLIVNIEAPPPRTGISLEINVLHHSTWQSHAMQWGISSTELRLFSPVRGAMPVHPLVSVANRIRPHTCALAMIANPLRPSLSMHLCAFAW